MTEPKAAGNRGKGRKAGTPNRTTRLAKEAIVAAAEGLGGTKRLIAWAKEDPLNERTFWGTIYPKLLPLQVAGELDHNVRVSGALAWQPPQ